MRDSSGKAVQPKNWSIQNKLYSVQFSITTIIACWNSGKSAKWSITSGQIWSACHLKRSFDNSWDNWNGMVHPGSMFSEEKVIPFEVFSSSCFYRNSWIFLQHLCTLTSARPLKVILARKNAKDLQDGGRFVQNVYCTARKGIFLWSKARMRVLLLG